jgi:hypothetical protein
MSHRLQVLFEEDEIAAVRAAARRHRLTVSEYVRQTLRNAGQDMPASDTGGKLLVVREAAAHAYPTGEPEVIDREIAQGYLEGTP